MRAINIDIRTILLRIGGNDKVSYDKIKENIILIIILSNDKKQNV